MYRLYALFEHPLAPLLVREIFLVVGQRRYNFHPVIGVEPGQIGFTLPRYGVPVYRNREVVPDHDSLAEFYGLTHEVVEVRIQLRGPSGDVEVLYLLVLTEYLQAPVCRIEVHLLGPSRRGVDVAVYAGLVAEPRNVHLERIDTEGRKLLPLIPEGFIKIVFDLVARVYSLNFLLERVSLGHPLLLYYYYSARRESLVRIGSFRESQRALLFERVMHLNPVYQRNTRFH